MKAFFATLTAAIAPLVAAHYTIPQLTVNGAISQPFQYIRETANHYRYAIVNLCLVPPLTA
jgi:hypothetical protein